ncbi:CDP-glycerol glycerophosphotransferase family protein [Halomonas sp. hl-4]|uniref:CDP-glycerol glycerophosphotransferase family protein n=1 Tax=Halomonas sp. hl-4 TaxID=1761789 RepID=UPI0018D4FC95|nr:CDP-glycerol glycerophosphotransferase family protein [Halomonas sp. hl-4]
MLLQLVAHGYEVQVLGATVFDNAKGMGRLKEQFSNLNDYLHQLIEAEDGTLTHQLVVSYSHNRNHFTTHEEGLWYGQYLYLLDSFKPDIVWFYGGQTLDLLIADEARNRGIPVASYLANGNYKASRWCRDVDLILTDSQATASMYRKTVGYTAKPVGKFIDPANFIADHHERKRLLFVNPSWQKGASVFVQLAEKFERERPDIELEVVEARADWPAVLRDTTRRMGSQRSALNNVTVTANTSDMRGPYSRARVLVAPSLWWESSGRVLAEAMLNGIPALITNRGGMPEMIGDAGMTFDFPDACYEEPYQHLLSDEELQPLFDSVINFYDDEALYRDYVARAWQVGEDKHHLDRATDRLLTALTPLVRQRAGNKDFSISQKKRHRQRLASRATKPEFKVDKSLQQLVSANAGTTQNGEPKANRLSLTDDFTWQVKGKVMVLDNRASLIKSGLADQMAATHAFGIVAFDPASEIKDTKQYEGSEYIQLFQHALLGDGQAATLHACVAPEMTSVLAPLPADKLPKRHQLAAKPLAELPINTVALDSIEGLGSLDWLILDELSDAIAVLEHGKKSLTDTLLIQVRVAFQLTHEHQPSFAELQHWASRNGFRFYRFHNIQHHSHLPDELSARVPCATEQESADVLFLPSHERMAIISDESKTKLAFILSAIFAAHDVAFDLIADVSQEKALEFLEGQSILPKLPEKGFSPVSTVEDLKELVSKSPLSRVKANHSLPGHLVVSLTSYTPRFENLHLTLRSLLLQEIKPDALILWIAEEEKSEIPLAVWQLEEYGLSIRFCENIHSYKKIIPTLREYPGSFIVTADDDLYYEPSWLKGLLNSWNGSYKTVVAHRAHKIRLDNKGNPKPYRQWKWEVGPDELSDGLIFPTSGAGVLYPPRIFHQDITNQKRFMEICSTADDVWLYWMVSLNGGKFKCSSYKFNIVEWPAKNNESLWQENIHRGGNDRNIKKIVDIYGKPWGGVGLRKNKARRHPVVSLVYRDFSGSNAVALYKRAKDFFPYNAKNVNIYHQNEINESVILKSDFLLTTHGPIVSKKDRLSGKTFIDLWHGFPMKNLGLMTEGVIDKEQVKRQWGNVDYMCAISKLDLLTKKESFDLGDNKLCITGYPRNDFLLHSNGRKNLGKVLGHEFKNKNIVLYAPTFRESVLWPNRIDGSKKWDNVFGFDFFNQDSFNLFLEENNIHFVVKLHPAEEPIAIKKIKPHKNISLLLSSRLNECMIDLYEVMNAFDLLMTDYSSIFIDYILLDRPVIFITPDEKEYAESRGIVSFFESFKCGPTCNDQMKLEKGILESINDSSYYKNARAFALNESHMHKDSSSSKRVWDLVQDVWINKVL